MRSHFKPVRMVVITKMNQWPALARMWRKKPSYVIDGNVEWSRHFGRHLGHSWKVWCKLTYSTAHPPLGICIKEMKAYALSKTCAWMFIIANNWKQLWGPSTSASAQWSTIQQEESNGWISATCWAKENRQSAVYCIFHLMNVQKKQIHSNSRFVVKAEVGGNGKWDWSQAS